MPHHIISPLTFQQRLPPRFVIERELGSGGFGHVWAVRDTEREALVALKALHEISPKTLLQFKNEFRGLTDLVHPNLVTLYELFYHDQMWFFTMELVPGSNFPELRAPRRGAPTRGASPARRGRGGVASSGDVAPRSQALERARDRAGARGGARLRARAGDCASCASYARAVRWRAAACSSWARPTT